MGKLKGFLAIAGRGVPETYAEFAPGYLSKGREAIDVYFADLSSPYTVSTPGCVSVACQSREDDNAAKEGTSSISTAWMVGATGIEPVTPTMST
jgi:hypothetical protein